MTDFWIKQDDLLPEITATLRDGAGAAVDLASAAVAFKMRLAGGTTLKVNAAATIVSAPLGQVKYTWTGTDTDTVGDYEAEWQVTFPSGKPETFPNDGYTLIKIAADL